MATTVTIVNTDVTNNTLVVDFTVALSGNYGGASTHGDTLSFAGFDAIKSESLPINVQLNEAPASGTAPTGYIFTYCPGTTQANGVLNISNNLTEYTEASAYSAGLLAAVIKGRAIFPSL